MRGGWHAPDIGTAQPTVASRRGKNVLEGSLAEGSLAGEQAELGCGVVVAGRSVAARVPVRCGRVGVGAWFVHTRVHNVVANCAGKWVVFFLGPPPTIVRTANFAEN